MMAPCSPAELKAMARGSSAGGTSSGTSACCAGIWKARTAPSTTDSASSSVRCDSAVEGRRRPAPAPPAPAAATQAATMRARWWRSTTWPATSTSASAGRNCSSPTSPRSQAEPVRSYICQPMATISIWLAAHAGQARAPQAHEVAAGQQFAGGHGRDHRLARGRAMPRR